MTAPRRAPEHPGVRTPTGAPAGHPVATGDGCRAPSRAGGHPPDRLPARTDLPLLERVIERIAELKRGIEFYERLADEAPDIFDELTRASESVAFWQTLAAEYRARISELWWVRSALAEEELAAILDELADLEPDPIDLAKAEAER
jgi:hypothetical protein